MRYGLGKRSLRLQDVENFVSCAAGLEQGLSLVVANSSGEGERGLHRLLLSKFAADAAAPSCCMCMCMCLVFLCPPRRGPFGFQVFTDAF